VLLDPDRAHVAIHGFQRFLGFLDREAEVLLAKTPWSCRGPGCCGCCYQVVLVGPLEALLLALHEVHQADWEMRVARLAQAAAPFRRLALTYQEHFQTAQLCPYCRAGSCEVYGVRPVVCRLYGVTQTDPGSCWPPGGKLNVIDTRDQMSRGYRWAGLAGLDLGLDDFRAPLSVMVLWGIGQLGTSEQREYVAQFNPIDVVQWDQRAAGRVPRKGHHG